jgi:glycine/D-amino acid oxidase-like deaminating enzyme
MERNHDGSVVVVGAGIVGCSIAVHLADRGLRPVLIDADQPGQGASTRSFASISAFGRTLPPTTSSPPPACRAGAGSPSGWGARSGCVGPARSAPGRRAGPDPAGDRRLLRPNDGQVEPPLVLAACRAVLERAGARLLIGCHARVRLDDDGVRVEVGDELLRPRTTVLAAGAEAVAVAAAVGLEVPTLASPGMLVETAPLPALTDRVVYLPVITLAVTRPTAPRWMTYLGYGSAALIATGVVIPLGLHAATLTNFAGYVAWCLWLIAMAIVLWHAPRASSNRPSRSGSRGLTRA